MLFSKTVNLNTDVRRNILLRWVTLVKIGDSEDFEDLSSGEWIQVKVEEHRASTFSEKTFDR